MKRLAVRAHLMQGAADWQGHCDARRHGSFRRRRASIARHRALGGRQQRAWGGRRTVDADTVFIHGVGVPLRELISSVVVVVVITP